MGQIEFDSDQKNAIAAAEYWYMNCCNYKKGKSIFVLSGYAGTGKSTILSFILARIGIPLYKVAFVTFTGKAANVLRQKKLNAFTIHSFIYNVGVTPTGQIFFRKKPKLPSNIELICIDEVGMVPNEIMHDILSYDVPVLCMGDGCQLPPIFGENEFISNPDAILSTVHRQKSDSSLLQLATDIRNGVNIYTQKYNDDVQIIPASKFNFNNILNYDQILCSTNANRYSLNVLARKLLKRKSIFPEAGEKIICEKNNFKDFIKIDNIQVFLVNGLTGINIIDSANVNDDIILLRFRPDTCYQDMSVYAKKNNFACIYDNTINSAHSDATDSDVLKFYEDGSVINEFTYGYAITTHKSQGSEWPSVLVYDDCFFKNDLNYMRWLYTSVTRAKEKVTIIQTNA